MQITKTLRDKVKVDYLLIEGKVDIDSNYFIKEINKGFKQKDNNNFKNNLKGHMTSWHYFNQHDTFIKTMLPLFDYLDNLE